MLRPATPLTVILFIAFAMTLIAVLSAPIIPAISLCTFQGVRYGVLGFCTDTGCTYRIGYDPQSTDFSVSSDSTRHTLTSILIVHPVACLFQLICLILSTVSHFHSPSHSSRYLLAVIIFMLPTLLVTLLSFLIDILLFIPRLNWAGWLVLVAVILDVLAGIMLCAMRRTLVSRKARTKRIAENAEMSGENFYNRQAAQAANQARAESPPAMGSEPSTTLVNGGPGADKLPQFATFDSSIDRKVSDDRVPLNERTDTATSGSSYAGRPSHEGGDVYAMRDMAARGGRGGSMRGRGGRPYGPARDEFGNPLPPSSAFGSNPSRPDSRNQGYRGGMGGPGGPPRGGALGRGGPPGPYGRGGGPPPGRGGMGRGGYYAGGAGDMGRGRGPPPGYSNESYQMQDRSQMNGGQGPRRQSPGPPSAPGYGPRRPSAGAPNSPNFSRGPGGYAPAPSSEDGQFARAESPPPLPGHASTTGRAESPPPLDGNLHFGQHREEEVFHDAVEMDAPADSMIGQAVEMDAHTGSPAQSPAFNQSTFPPHQYQQRTESPLRQGSAPPMSPSVYSSQATDSVYVPARAAWQSNTGAAGYRQQTPPAELSGNAGRRANTTSPLNQQVQQGPTYYEDVDPRWSGEGQLHPQHANIGVATDHVSQQQQGYGGHQGGGYAY